MRFILLFLFPLFLNAQVDTTITLWTRSPNIDYIEYYAFKSYFENPTIVFSITSEEVKFTPGRIVYVDSLSNSKVVECDSAVLRILSTVNEKVFTEQSERLNQLQLKVYWYEQHFGKLEGNMYDECVEFNPIENPPKIEPCKKK